MPHFYVCLKFACCSCVRCGLEARLHSLRPSLTSYGVSCFLISPFYDLLPLGVGLYLIVGFSFFSPLFCSFLQSYCHFLLNYSVIPVVMSFDPGLLGSFGSAAYSSLNDSVWSLGLLITLLAGSCVPFISFWAPLAHSLSFGILNPF